MTINERLNKKKYYIATVTNCNEKGENIVVKKSKPFDKELYSSTSLSKCFNWIVSNFQKIGNNGDYDIMLKKESELTSERASERARNKGRVGPKGTSGQASERAAFSLE